MIIRISFKIPDIKENIINQFVDKQKLLTINIKSEYTLKYFVTFCITPIPQTRVNKALFINENVFPPSFIITNLKQRLCSV